MREPGITRREFLKLVSLTATTAASRSSAIGKAAEFTLGNHSDREVPLAFRIGNAVKVTKEIAAAELSKDEARIRESRKLAIAWLFAETASVFGAAIGMGKAAKNFEHFLYGDGKDVDMSSEFKSHIESQGEDAFLNELFLIVYLEMYDPNKPSINQKKMITNQIMSNEGVTITSAGYIGKTDTEKDDLFQSFGFASFNIKSDEVQFVKSGEKFIITNGVTVSVKDRYDWDKDYSIEIEGYAAEFVGKAVAEPLFQWFFGSPQMVEQFLNFIQVPDNTKTKLLDIYNEYMLNFSESVSNKTRSKVLELELEILDHKEILRDKDLALLKKIGAQDYNVVAQAYLDGRREIRTG